MGSVRAALRSNSRIAERIRASMRADYPGAKVGGKAPGKTDSQCRPEWCRLRNIFMDDNVVQCVGNVFHNRLP